VIKGICRWRIASLNHPSKHRSGKVNNRHRRCS
jgi:hypothetical protein